MRSALRTAVLGLLLLVMAGCDNDPDNTHPSLPPKREKQEAPKPTAAGSWVGRWESAGHPGHGGGLTCEAAETGKDQWSATFSAEFGKVKDYKIALKGKPEGDKIAFGGDVDIGQEKGEGLFKWKGKATATEFSGEYEGGGDRGTFKMTRPAKKAEK